MNNNTKLTYLGLEPKSFHTIKVLSTTWASTLPLPTTSQYKDQSGYDKVTGESQGLNWEENGKVWTYANKEMVVNQIKVELHGGA